jgi:hypothetical protein
MLNLLTYLPALSNLFGIRHLWQQKIQILRKAVVQKSIFND